MIIIAGEERIEAGVTETVTAVLGVGGPTLVAIHPVYALSL
jgi:hypothetical protein